MDSADAMPFHITPATIGRFTLAVVLFGASMHYLVSGRKEASLNKMFVGALLALASIACL